MGPPPANAGGLVEEFGGEILVIRDVVDLDMWSSQHNAPVQIDSHLKGLTKAPPT